MAVIATSPDLMPAGRAKNLDKRRADASKVLDPLRATIERTRQRLVDVERSAVPPRPATQDQSTIAREREIRDRLTGKESLTVLHEPSTRSRRATRTCCTPSKARRARSRC